MKFTIQREQLLKTLQLVTGVVERRQTLPVLSNLLVKATDNRLQLTGTDLEVELVAECEALVEQTGEATLPARKLADIWRSLADGAEVSVSVEGDRAIVRSGRSRFTLATLPAADFPKVPAGEANVSVQIGQSDLKSLIDDVGFAMAQQDVRYFLNGMLLEVTSDHIRTVATDGHRLAMATAEGGAEVGLRALLEEMERAKRFGFSEGELSRAKEDILAGYEVAYAERNDRNSSSCNLFRLLSPSSLFCTFLVSNYSQTERQK